MRYNAIQYYTIQYNTIKSQSQRNHAAKNPNFPPTFGFGPSITVGERFHDAALSFHSRSTIENRIEESFVVRVEYVRRW